MNRGVNLPLFLLAIICAVVIKVAVNEARQLTETTINAQMNYNTPEGVMILEPVRQVAVRLRGERSEIGGLNPFAVQVEVSLTADELGLVDITGERLNVRTPGDFEVISIEPNRLTLTVEQVDTRSLPVVAVLSGEPAAGAVHGKPEVRPKTVRVEGPRSRLRAVSELTAPVNLNGHALTFEEKVSILSPDPLIKVVDPLYVVVFIPMMAPGTEEPIEEFLDPSGEP